MNVVARTIITASVLFISFCFLYWYPFSFFPFAERNVFSDSLAFLCAAAIREEKVSGTSSPPNERSPVSALLCFEKGS